MIPSLTYKMFPLGDSAITIDFVLSTLGGNVIDEEINQHVISLFQYLTDHPLPHQKEIVSAFSSITVYYKLYDLRKNIAAHLSAYEWMQEKIVMTLKMDLQKNNLEEGIIRIPVCYEQEFATDIEMMAIEKQLSVEEIILLHTSVYYRVYMLGFLPGFAYMGKVNEQLNFSRKQQPHTIKAGSVGIAGRQTGIYPLDSPGGWQIIGRTPIKMFEASPPKVTKDSFGESFRTNSSKGVALEQSLCFLNAGDTVQFFSITSEEFYSLTKTRSGV